MTDPHHASSSTSTNDDDKELEALGYVPSFKREFSNLATVSPSPPAKIPQSGREI